MAVTKTIELLGTTGINKSTSILAYNSETFLDKNIAGRLGLENKSDLLSSVPTSSNVATIYEILTDTGEFIKTPKDSSSTDEDILFNFDNDRSNNISGQGFNTIIFLSDSGIVGFIVLESVQGLNVNTSSTSYVLKRNYLIKYITISIKSGSGEIRVDKDIIKLSSEVKSVAEKIDRDYTGDNNYNFATKKSLTGSSISGNNNYEIHIKPILNGKRPKDIFTDTTYSKINPDGTIVFSKLGIKKNLIIDSTKYSGFNNTQIGYFNGDPSLFIWDDNNRYSIFSLTKSMKNIFGDEASNYRPFPYTTSRNGSNGLLISQDEIYYVPLLYEGAVQTIEYFAGQYVVVSIEDTLYLFNILRQSGEIGLTSPLYEKNSGWVISSTSDLYNEYEYYIKSSTTNKWEAISEDPTATLYERLDYVPLNVTGSVKIPKRSYNFVNSFILDKNDIYNRLFNVNSLKWSTYKNSVSDVSSLSETYLDSKYALSSGEVPIEKIGDWYVFKNEDTSTLVYSNMTKSIKISLSENRPIIINDQVLLMWSQQDDAITYSIYDEPGYYITPTCFNQRHAYGKDTYSDGDSRNKNYIIYTSTRFTKKYLTIINKSSSSNQSSSPSVLQRSFLGTFRRNILPETLEGFKIIGSMAGIIFYRIENMINYL